VGFREDAADILKGFDALVVPSLMESFPNVILEAMMLKVPVVGTAVGGIGEMLSNDKGILIKAKKISALSSAIEYILNNNTKDMVDRAYRYAKQHYTIQIKEMMCENIYRMLLRKKR
jgi:glycosyltransferase involved in cell wall biosynthesis